MKILKTLIIALLCVSFSFNTSVFSKEISSFYVKTEENEDIDEFVKGVFDKLLVAQDNLSNVENITLGQGIKVVIPETDYNYYIYPVLCSGEIIDIINVTEKNGEFSATYTRQLVSTLEELRLKTSKETPMTIIRYEDYLYAEIGNERYLLEYHNFNNTIKNSIETLDDLPSVDNSSMIVTDIFKNTIENHVASIAIPLAPVKKLSWTIYEIQGSQDWCASITTTNIIRNTTSKYMTSAQMRDYLNDYGGLTVNQVIFYLKNTIKI